MPCKYKITVSSPALLTGVTADLNNKVVEMETTNRKKYESDEVKRDTDSSGRIEIDIHVRGRQGAKVTIKVENVTKDQEILSVESTIGSQRGVVSTRYEIKDKKVASKC